jgi:U3 small nucleolar RNA-associated protein 12
MLVKFWDLDTRHCFKTLVMHRSEISDLILINNEKRLITGCHDNELRVFDLIDKCETELNGLHEKGSTNLTKKKAKLSQQDALQDGEDEQEEKSDLEIIDCIYAGSLIRESKDHLNQLCVDSTLSIFSSHSFNEKHIEFYKINTPEEIKKRMGKKLKKQKRKIAKSTSVTNSNGLDEEPDKIEDVDDVDLNIEQTIEDEFSKICMLNCKHKIKYIDLLVEKPNQTASVTKNHVNSFEDDENKEVANKSNDQVLFTCKVACILHNNQIEIYSFSVFKNVHLNMNQTPALLSAITMPGHRTDVRTLCFNSDSSSFISASGDSLKVWNRMSLNCIRSLSCDYALCCLFLSDDKHALIGTKVFRFIRNFTWLNFRF